MVVLVTAVAGYFLNQHIYEWGYRHREEESLYSKKMRYVCDQSTDIALAKDIRIFGMVPWLNDVYDDTLRLYRAFVEKREKFIYGRI